ncbi:D-Ala-D-Ala carboxypeptidase family metallohydrolase [Acinetobacter sp. MB5]|uniref:D-Ala-D-Ala carboxypeptidase family metallohydrolase n=1 Tax=Acinetobacter sp. MB5 TaxID=2069438 RepID=UPI000DD00769|nr:D-Ala-D-Ala carboxypeptidase family metallohydrolase [Acinetobacter sp. MB5]
MLLKRISILLTISCSFIGCTETPPTSKSITKIPVQPSIPHTALPPISYQSWLLQSDHQYKVQAYKSFLAQQQVQFVVPDFEMFRSARDWQQCNYDEYDVPEPSVWQNAVPTLRLLKHLHDTGIITDFEVTSSYRSPYLNRCAGGAKSSSHVLNSAIDFRIGPPQPSEQEVSEIQATKIKLCKFWQQEGQALNMGLGIYSTGQIHIDTQGFRTWGPDHTWHSSLCGEIIQ